MGLELENAIEPQRVLNGPAADLLAGSRVQESHLGITPPPQV